MSVIEVVMISSPGLGSMAPMAMWDGGGAGGAGVGVLDPDLGGEGLFEAPGERALGAGERAVAMTCWSRSISAWPKSRPVWS